MLITMFASNSAHCGAKSAIAASIPGLVSPTEFSKVVSPASRPSRNDAGNQRGSGLPSRGLRVKVLGKTAPRDASGASGARPRPYPSYPKVPDAIMTGLLNDNPSGLRGARSTDRSMVCIGSFGMK